MKPKIYTLFLMILVSGCNYAQTMEKDTIFTYSDGNNNTYFISQDSIKYEPMEKIRSSSGLYSGGEAKSIAITGEEFEKLEAIINAAIENKSMHIDQRVKMSGMLTYQNNVDEVTIILGARSKSKADIEMLLKKLFEDKD